MSEDEDNPMDEDLRSKPDAYWHDRLTPEQYQVARLKGTERPFTGVYNNHKEKGVYRCVACDQPLFTSETRFSSGTGWPSFWDAIDEANVELKEDLSHGMRRVEVLCSRCGAHLGHVFPDGPQPTGQRYCINSISLDFEAAEDQ
jgi:peptide-methionine (R)-S-oxide reductase